MAVAMFLFLATDSFIAFKSTMLYFSGLWLMILLKQMYQSPRPFWVDPKVKVLVDECKTNYGSPSSHLYNLWFFYGYCIHMYLYKYRAEVNYKLLYSALAILAVLIIILLFSLFVQGTLFIYQSIISILFSVSFNILCINFDQ